MNKLVYLAVASVLYGCGGGTDAPSSTSATTQSAPTAPASPTPPPAPVVTTAPKVTLNANSLSFGEILVGAEPSPKTVTIKNDGDAILKISGVTVGGVDASNFVIINNNCKDVAVGGSCTIDIRFVPKTTAGNKSATLNIASNASSTSLVSLSGIAGFIGDFEYAYAKDACDLKQRRPDVKNGAYWFRPNASVPAVKTYADFTLSTKFGACWMQVRRIVGTGGWFPLNDDFEGTAELNATFSTEYNSTTNWTIPWSQMFVKYPTGYTNIMLATGDNSYWCVIRVVKQPAESGAQSLVADANNGKVGAIVNTLFRGATNPEDPWIGCEGTFAANQSKMLYGEAGSNLYTTFKNAHGGINVYVQFVEQIDGGG